MSGVWVCLTTDLEQLVLVVRADDADLLPRALVDPGRDHGPDEVEEEGRVDHQDAARPLHVMHLHTERDTTQAAGSQDQPSSPSVSRTVLARPPSALLPAALHEHRVIRPAPLKACLPACLSDLHEVGGESDELQRLATQVLEPHALHVHHSHHLTTPSTPTALKVPPCCCCSLCLVLPTLASSRGSRWVHMNSVMKM